MNPRSLANLRPWKKGDVPNPAGRPSAGGAVKEFLNAMQGLTKQQVQEIVNDPNEQVNRIAAARLWLSACDDSSDLDMIMGHTDGKPAATLKVKGDVNHHHVVKEAMRDLLGKPEAVAHLKALARIESGN